MGNTIANEVDIYPQKITQECREPLGVLLYGDKVCREEYGNNWKYINIEKDNCEQNKLKAVCQNNPILEESNKITNGNDSIYICDSCSVNKPVQTKNKSNRGLIKMDNIDICDLKNNIENNNKFFPTIQNDYVLDIPNLTASINPNDSEVEKNKFPQQRKVCPTKINLPETANIFNYLNEEALIYPKELFTQNVSSRALPETTNLKCSSSGINIFFLIIVCIIIFFVVVVIINK